jgi:Glycoside hydrolase 131 catalytic N-terminal domain
VLIDNSSVFTPGSSKPQFGFRRSELIAQQSQNGNRTSFDQTLESGVTAFHFSVQADTTRPLNNTHEYQAVFIEITDGTHVFELQTGTCRAWPGEPARELFFSSSDPLTD